MKTPPAASLPAALLLSLIGGATVAQARADEYEQAFSKSETPVAAPAPEEEPVETVAAERLETAVDSFPIALGETSGKAPSGTAAPKRLSRKMRLGSCVFRLNTGAYAVNTYSVAGVGAYELANDALPPNSVVEPQGGDYYVTISTALFAAVEGDGETDCRRAFSGGRRLQAPTVRLGGTVEAVTGAKRLPGSTVADVGTPERLWVQWDSKSDSLVVRNDEGVAPMIETSLFRLGQGAKGGWLVFQPVRLSSRRP